jgi:hypothetical protein
MRRNPVLKRQGLLAVLIAAFSLFGLTAVRADDPEVLFSAKPGDRTTYAVSYWRGGSVGGRFTATTVVRYDLAVEIKSVSPEGVVATVTTGTVDVSVDGKRVLAPPDFDSLIYAAADGVPMDVRISADGIVDAVLDWDKVKASLTENAVAKAGTDNALRLTAESFFETLTPVAAGEILARPLALGAPGRIVKLESPARRTVDARGIALPSFASAAKGNWTFTLIPTPAQGRFPDAVTIEWLGVPNPEELRAILGAMADQLAETDPETAPAMSIIEQDARMWQRFIASYDPATGQLEELAGQMELRAGPIQRKVAIEAIAKAE